MSRAWSRGGDDDPTAVGIRDIVQTKKVPRTPTNQGASAFLRHGRDLHLGRLLSRENADESVAGFYSVETSGRPRTELWH